MFINGSFTFNSHYTSLPSQPSAIELNAVNEPAEYAEIPGEDGDVQNWEFGRENLKLVKPLGCGEFGQVYKGLAHGLNQSRDCVEVAVKLLKGITSSWLRNRPLGRCRGG